MDFSVIFQLRTKKFWWMDVIFYFVMSLLVATIICYLIFLIKNSIQRLDIQKEINSLQTVGTDQQKEHETEVIEYQKKINDFSDLFKNHGFASQVFYFMQQETRPNVWFDRFDLQQKEATVDLSGQADDNEAFSRQIDVFEKSEYIKSIDILNSSLTESSGIKFNLSLSLDPKIFSYIADLEPILATTTPSNQPATQTGNNQNNSQSLSSDKLMIIFKFPQLNQVNGIVDLTNNTVTVNVPFGTNVSNLTPSMVISPNAAVSPDSGIRQDFTNPVVYRITAQDGSTQDYTVAVKVLPKVVKKSAPVWITILTIILSILLVAAVIAGAFFLYKKRFTWLNIKPKI